jgi:hypothetical protein
MPRLRDKVMILNAPSILDPFNPGTVTTRDWDNAVETPERAEMRPSSSDETLVNEDTVTSFWRVLLSPNTVATYASRVRWRGLLFEVDGEVQPVPDHMHRIRNCTAMLKRVTG